MDTTLSVKRWQDWGNLLLGVWLFVSPWIMQYASVIPVATWNANILGAAIVIFAAFAVYMPRVWEEGLNFALGIWLIISPWVLGFEASRDVTTNTVGIGVLVAALALWAMVQHKDFEKWRHDRHAAP